ncbi:hypothetical protein [uncultured Agrococcus sp.]
MEVEVAGAAVFVDVEESPPPEVLLDDSLFTDFTLEALDDLESVR